MKKFLLFTLLITFVTTIYAQASKEILQSGIRSFEARKLLNNGYLSSNGWLLQKGDTLNLGAGTNPNHSYSFIYEPNLNAYLRPGQTTKAIIKRFKLLGKKKVGFTCVAVVTVGLSSRYFVDIENAETSYEILKPEKEANRRDSSNLNSNENIIEQIKKWKELLDDGAITQQEYEGQKKKLLDE